MSHSTCMHHPLPEDSHAPSATVQALANRLTLAELPLRQDAWVDSVRADGEPEQQALSLRLLEIGFLPDQRVRVVARAAGGGDPIAVRVGRSTFALRRGEAALVRVRCTEVSLGGPPL